MRKHGRICRDCLATIPFPFFEVGEHSELGVLEKLQDAKVATGEY